MIFYGGAIKEERFLVYYVFKIIIKTDLKVSKNIGIKKIHCKFVVRKAVCLSNYDRRREELSYWSSAWLALNTHLASSHLLFLASAFWVLKILKIGFSLFPYLENGIHHVVWHCCLFYSWSTFTYSSMFEEPLADSFVYF